MIYSKDESSLQAIVKKEKKTYASLAGALQTANVVAAVPDTYSVKKEKALNLWAGDTNRKCVPIGGDVLLPLRNHRAYVKVSARGPVKWMTPSHPPQARGGSTTHFDRKRKRAFT